MENIQITTFNGDWEMLAMMSKDAWRSEYQRHSFPNLYRRELLEHYFAGTNPNHHTAAYDGTKLVSFLGNIVRTYSVKGKIHKGVISCLLFTHRDYMRKGLAMKVITEAVERNKAWKVIDFSLNYLDRGHASTLVIEKFREQKYRIEHVKDLHVVTRIIDLPKVKENEGLKWYHVAAAKLIGAHGIPKFPEVSGKVRAFEKKDAPECMALLNTYQNYVPLARVWTLEELERHFEHPPVSYTLVYEDQGKVKGVINYSIVEHITPKPAFYAWLDNLHYANLSPKEQQFFLASFLQEASQKGCIGVLEWNKNYYDKKPLWKSRFIPFPRFIQLVSWTFNPEISLAELPAYYEQQL